jgi:hypothetical protein
MPKQRPVGFLRPESTTAHANAVLKAALDSKTCTCGSEGPAASHHQADCRYRLLVEAAQQLDAMTNARALSLPEGWRVLPETPTPEMLESTPGTKPGHPVADMLRKAIMKGAAEDYGNMLQHAPKTNLEFVVSSVVQYAGPDHEKEPIQ